MESTLSLLSRYQAFLDFARQMPDVDTAAVETYMLFFRVASDISAAQQAFYERFGLSEGKHIVLLHLCQAPHYRMTPSALAEAARVTRGTITGLLTGLERSGLVKRNDHPDDGRMVTIELTQKGLDLLEQILPERLRRMEQFLSSLSKEEQHQLRTLLEKMHSNLDALNGP
jgi:DNA-binding MarR family transcriptional regulator